MSAHFTDEHLTVYAGDVRDVLPTLPAESVHCAVTSPPYWGLRDYGTPGQLGLEPTPEEYVANMVAVFREVRRVLRADGTVWLNLGDSYAAGGGFSPDAPSNKARLNGESVGKLHSAKPENYLACETGGKKAPPGLKPKDLVGIPWRVAFALQADGWYLRSDVIWSKPNPMPESVTDRPTKSHEYLFLLTKSARYWYDADAVREAVTPANREHNERYVEASKAYRVKMAATDFRQDSGQAMYPTNPAGRNLRSVWTIATQPYPGAHFATFPEKLVEPCVKAGTSERGVCPECGAPWTRVVEVGPLTLAGTNRRPERGKHENGDAAAQKYYGEGAMTPGAVRPRETTGWRPSCDHDAEPVPATVLDPFAGSGTTARVANRLGRRAVLIDLSADYIDQAMLRNAQAPLGLGA